jgi:hypothetical protein
MFLKSSFVKSLIFFSFLATFHSFVNARYTDISIDRNDFDAGFLITFRKKSNFTLQKAMIFGQKMTIIIITIMINCRHCGGATISESEPLIELGEPL